MSGALIPSGSNRQLFQQNASASPGILLGLFGERFDRGDMNAHVVSCCRPLHRSFYCLTFDMHGCVRLCIFLQMIYGILLIGLHVLLLAPPFNEPQCEWFPGAGPWLQLLDLQWSLRIRGNGGENWETPVLRYNEHGNFAGTILGLIVGVFTFLVSLVADGSLRRSGQGRLHPLAKFWLGFTTLQVPAFFACNMGKLGTLCSFDDQNGSVGVSKLFPRVAGHCGVLTLWYVEWTLMCSCIAGLGLWVCWSFVSFKLQTDISEYSEEYLTSETAPRE